jgi:hypothetical protein
MDFKNSKKKLGRSVWQWPDIKTCLFNSNLLIYFIYQRCLNLFKKKLKLANFSFAWDSFLNMLIWVSSFVTEQAIATALRQ